MKHESKQGFTLIELSIVLVVIGLLVGGVLVGQNLINAAAVRSQISQIEKYQQAVNAFRGKYGYLPGDIRDPDASSFGFQGRGQYAGEGDGNGIIEGVNANASASNSGTYNGAGETAVFWADLSTAKLIESSFNAASSTLLPGGNSTAISNYMPLAKVGSSNYIYVYSNSGLNYFAVSAVNMLYTGSGVISYPALPVSTAYAIDQKVDDGFPQTGIVTARYLNNYLGGIPWAAGGTHSQQGYTAGSTPGAGSTGATVGSSTTCYDNGGSLGTRQTYSVEISNGSNVNCALSFLFQ